MKLLRALVLIAFAVTALVGCSKSTPTAKTANVTAGTMPSDAEWDGVYYSPLFGYLHLARSGGGVKGRWQRPLKGRWGTLEGTLDGNLLRFEWTEYVDGLVGPNSKKVGKGYFLYTRPDGDNVDDALNGEVGQKEDEVGLEWKAVKQRNVKPDLAAINGSGTGEVGGGEWDSKNTEDPDDAEAPEADDDDDTSEPDDETGGDEIDNEGI